MCGMKGGVGAVTKCLAVEFSTDGRFRALTGQPERWDDVIARAAGIGHRRSLQLGAYTACYRVRSREGTLRDYLVAERDR